MSRSVDSKPNCLFALEGRDQHLPLDGPRTQLISILAHGGRITGDEIAILSAGLLVAFAIPIGALLIAIRRTRRTADTNPEPDSED